MDFREKNVLIVGDGVSGVGAYKVLDGRGAHCTTVKNADECYALQYDLIVVSPGVPADSAVFAKARADGTKLIGEFELGWILNGDRPVIAITGTNGKTTVTELVASILSKVGRVAACGNIGTAFSECAFEGNYDTAVAEVSSFQLETTDTFAPHIACITNIDCDHLDRHKTLENYAKVKLRIAENQTENDFLVLSQDFINASLLKNFCPRSDVFYTSLCKKVRGAYLEENKIKFMNEYICNRDELPLTGGFNVANVLTAVCACRLYGADIGVIRDGIMTFSTDEHRLKQIECIDGRIYWDDSKGTNIAASLAACGAMLGDTLVIMGGSDKGYGYELFFEKLPDCVKEIALIGQTADKIADAARKSGFESIKRCGNLESAVVYASTRPVRNVLLSPASASFDMFENYKKRGDAFIEAVRGLKK